MNKTDKENLKLIEYRLDEQDKRVDLLHNWWWCYRSPCRKFLGYVHKLNQKKSKKSLTFSFIISIIICNDNEKDIRKICDWGRDYSFSNYF
jgi:hypothetical protein